MKNLTKKLSFQTSEPEELCREGFRRFGLKPLHNYQVDFFYIDFAFPDKKVGIEVDSMAWHTDLPKDLRRHNYLKNKGWKLYHFMAKTIFNNPRIPAAYVYLKEYADEKELIKLANFEIYKLTRHFMSDRERERFNKTLEDDEGTL